MTNTTSVSKINFYKKLDETLAEIINGKKISNEQNIGYTFAPDAIDIAEFEENFLLPKIISKLKKDGYIEPESNNPFVPTLGGLLLFQRGGYEQEWLNSIQDRNRLNLYQSNAEAMEKRSLLLTYILAGGAAVAAIYYLLEILKIFCHC